MIWLTRALVAIVLIASGILKAADPAPVLVISWLGDQPVARSLIGLIAWVEILAGLLLLSELPLRWSAVPAALLCLGFVLITAIRLAVEGTLPDCGCFGVLSAPLDQWHLAGVAVLAALSCHLWWAGRARPRITPA